MPEVHEDAPVAPVEPVAPVSEAPPVPKVKPVTEINLDAAQGSAIQIAFLAYQNQLAQVEKTALEVQVHEGNVRAAQDRLKMHHGVVQQSQSQLTMLLAKHSIPDGWRWDRAENGTYKFSAPKGPGPGMPPLRHTNA